MTSSCSYYSHFESSSFHLLHSFYYYLDFRHLPIVTLYLVRHWAQGRLPYRSRRHLADGILNACFWIEMDVLSFVFHWNLFPGVQLIICQHWFQLWIGPELAAIHYLNKSWRITIASLGHKMRNFCEICIILLEQSSRSIIKWSTISLPISELVSTFLTETTSTDINRFLARFTNMGLLPDT